jgi:hypothetical protein
MKHGKLEGRHTSFASINFVFCVGGAKTFFIKASATWKIGVNKSKLDPFPNPSFFLMEKGVVNLIRRTKITNILLASGNRVDAHTLQRLYHIFVHLVLPLHSHFLDRIM